MTSELKPSTPEESRLAKAAARGVAPGIGLQRLENRGGFLLARASRWSQEELASHLAPLGVSLAQYTALLVIDENSGLSQTLLAKVLGMARSRLVPFLDELEAKGLVTRNVEEGNRRANALHLTDKGKQLLGEAERIGEEHEARLRAMLGTADYDRLVEILSIFMGEQ